MSATASPVTVEGVRYFKYLVRYVALVAGKPQRRRKVLYSPGPPWVGEAFARFVDDTGLIIKPGSNVVIRPRASR